MALEVDANNPLGLTVAGPGYGNPNASLYPGQVGSVSASTGYTFATFGNQNAGIAAGVNYITQKINSGAATTVQSLVNLFSPNDLQAFMQTTGLGPNDPVNASQAGLYAAGIAAGEGTLSAFGGVNAFTGLNATMTAAGTAGQSGSGSTPAWLQAIQGWVGNATGNIVFVILGIVLLAAALYMMAVSAKLAPSPAEIGETAGKVALAAG